MTSILAGVAARMQAAQLRIQKRPVDLADTVTEAAASYGPVAAEAGVALTLSLEPGIVVEADPDRLLQVANNLLGNAVKSTPAGGQVTVVARTEGGAAVLEVSDTGPGMTLEQLGGLFQPSPQVHKERDAMRGTGLGLSIIKGIVEQHGGRIEATSPGPGRGSTFRMTLPCSTAQAVPRLREPKTEGFQRRLRDLI